MTRNTRLTLYDEAANGAFDEGAGRPDFMAYGSTSTNETEDAPFSEDPMPLFLSGEPEAPRQRGFGTGGDDIYRDRAPLWPRMFKVGIFVAAAAGIALAISSMDNPLALFANAKASLPGTAAVQPSAAPPTPALQSAARVPASPPAASVAPTRDEIAAALRTAGQVQPGTASQVPPEVRQPPPPPVAAAPARRLDADELAALLKRAKGLIAVGDISPARLLLERAADAQEASAALLLAQTYDPTVLGKQDMRSVTPDPAMARAWYQKAAQLGSLDAQQILAQIQN